MVKRKDMRSFCIVFIVIAVAAPVFAQDGQGWTFSGRLSGTSNSSAFVTKADSTLGYGVNRHLHTYVGVPVYIVKGSSTTQTPSTFMSGLGNAYLGFNVYADSDSVNYTSTVEATAPTGSRDEGFSTGHVTVDWTNSFSHSFSSVTPFASIGLANTVSDTSFFVRPFTSSGLVSHFDGGATFALAPFADLGASGYAVKASGEQTIISKSFRELAAAPTTPTSPTSNLRGQATDKTPVFKNNRRILGGPELADDHGFSTWVAARASKMDFQVGYTRSVGYDLNSVFFGVGFRIGQ
jgi:hypothetical protein